MKKFIALLLMLVMVLSLAACTANNEDAGSETPTIGVTIYKYDDNFMSFVRRAIETKATDKATLEMNDSQNSQATQNDQVDTMISKGAKSLAINLVDP